MSAGGTGSPRDSLPTTTMVSRRASGRQAREHGRRSRITVMASPSAIPDDLLINAADEIRIRQDLVLTALGRRPADRALRVGRLLDVHSRSWSEDHEIVFKGRRIAWVGPAGSYPGGGRERVAPPNLAAVSGFGVGRQPIQSA